MRARSWLLGTLCLLLPLAVACNRSSQSSAPTRDGTALESPQAGDRCKECPRARGAAPNRSNPDKETLIVAFGDDLYEFAYTDATESRGRHGKRARPHGQHGQSDHGALPGEPDSRRRRRP